MKRKALGYTFVVMMFSIFALIIYGAYSPARKSQKQQIVCFKFKKDVSAEAVERHMHDFAGLKHEIPQIVSYSAGKTLPTHNSQSPEYDAMHYITFQNKADIETYTKSAKYQEFVKNNRSSWEKVMIINSDIRQ